MKRDYDDEEDSGFRGQKRRRDNSDRQEIRVLLQSKVIVICSLRFTYGKLLHRKRVYHGSIVVLFFLSLLYIQNAIRSLKLFHVLYVIHGTVWEILLHLALFSFTVICLQFWAYGSWYSLFHETMETYESEHIFHDKSAIPLHPGTRWNKNFASQRQNYE